MCKYIDSFDTNSKFIILMHPKEFKKVKNNTGFFTHLSLKNSEVFIGIDFSENRRINEIIKTHNSYILFPSDNAINLTDKIISKMDIQKPLAIFIIDSTWACTKKIFTLSNNLNRLKHISFSTTRKSKYEIKTQLSHLLQLIRIGIFFHKSFSQDLCLISSAFQQLCKPYLQSENTRHTKLTVIR